MSLKTTLPLLAHPLAGERSLAILRRSSGSGEAMAAVQPVRAFVLLLMGPEVNPRVAPPARFIDESVQHDAADSLPPPLRYDVHQVEEQDTRDHRARSIPTAHGLHRRHPDTPRPVLGQ